MFSDNYPRRTRTWSELCARFLEEIAFQCAAWHKRQNAGLIKYHKAELRRLDPEFRQREAEVDRFLRCEQAKIGGVQPDDPGVF